MPRFLTCTGGGILRIESDEENLRIKLLKGVVAGEDVYERNVLRFLRDYAENGVFDAKRFKESVESLRDSAKFGGDAMLDLSSLHDSCLLYTSPSPRDRTRSRMPSSA